LIYVSPDHSCWLDDESARKVKKSRFGGVEKSRVDGLARMMDEYLPNGSEWLEEKVDTWLKARGLGAEGRADDTEEDELAP
jgi:histone deacetylase 6